VSHCGSQRLLWSSWFGSVPQSLAYMSLRFMAERLPMVASNNGITTFPVSMSRVRHWLQLVTGAILLALRHIQFFGPIRDNVPALHRWIGRLYTLAAFIAGIGGLTFIALKGTIGGASMNLGLSLYGALMLIASVETIWNAWKRNFVQHRAWAIRLFALAIGSWLYRMDYGFWLSLTPGLGHTKTFDGPFDVVMSFFSSFRICLLRSSSSKNRESMCCRE
jgi:Predicted membrane protein (DUF2306)